VCLYVCVWCTSRRPVLWAAAGVWRQTGVESISVRREWARWVVRLADAKAVQTQREAARRNSTANSVEKKLAAASQAKLSSNSRGSRGETMRWVPKTDERIRAELIAEAQARKARDLAVAAARLATSRAQSYTRIAKAARREAAEAGVAPTGLASTSSMDQRLVAADKAWR